MRFPWNAFGPFELPVAEKNGTERSTALSTQTTESSPLTLWVKRTVDVPSTRRLTDELARNVEWSTAISASFEAFSSIAWACEASLPCALKTGLSPSSTRSQWLIRIRPDQSPDVRIRWRFPWIVHRFSGVPR